MPLKISLVVSESQRNLVIALGNQMGCPKMSKLAQLRLIKLIKETGEPDVLLSSNFDTWLSFAIEMDL